MPAVLTPPAEPDPDDRDSATEYVPEHELRERGIDPALVRVLCPWATELRTLDGARCWALTDLASLLEGN